MLYTTLSLMRYWILLIMRNLGRGAVKAGQGQICNYGHLSSWLLALYICYKWILVMGLGIKGGTGTKLQYWKDQMC